MKELEPNGAVVANIRVFVAPMHTSQDCLQEMSGVSNNVGMKMKQMLKPKAVPTVFPKALPNCSTPLYKKNPRERSTQKGEQSQRTVSRRHKLDNEYVR